MLKDSRLVQHVTLAPTSEELTIAGVTVTAFNLGGQVKLEECGMTFLPPGGRIVQTMKGC